MQLIYILIQEGKGIEKICRKMVKNVKKHLHKKEKMIKLCKFYKMGGTNFAKCFNC